MEILFVTILSILNIGCFFIGLKIGLKVSKGEEPKITDPIKAVEDYKEEKEEKKESRKQKEELQIMLENINNYDGTGSGQKDLP